MIRIVHPGSRIRILIFYPSRIPGSKRHRIPDLQHCGINDELCRDEDGNLMEQSEYAKEIKKRLAHAPSSAPDSRTASPGHVDRIKNIGTSSGFVDKPGNKIALTGKAEKAERHIKHTFATCFFLCIQSNSYFFFICL